MSTDIEHDASMSGYTGADDGWGDWIDWHGGECPIPDGTTTQVRLYGVNKDGSGYISIDEEHFTLEDDRGGDWDGPNGSVHWITWLPPGEMTALRDFLNGVSATPSPDRALLDMAVEALEENLCPRPIEGKGTIKECVEAGFCGCGNRSTLATIKQKLAEGK